MSTTRPVTPPPLASRRQVEIYDTTLRDGSQLEGISLTVDDKLRIAEQLDWLGVALHRRRAGPAPTRRTTSSSGGPRPSSTSTTQHAGRVRLDPPGEGQGRRRRHPAPTCSRPARRHRLHRRQVLGLPRHRGAPAPTLDEGVAMVGDSVEFLAAAGPRGVLRRRALLRRLQAQPRVQPAGARGARRRRAPTRLVLCDTNGGSLPARGRADRARGGRLLRRRRRRRACTSTTTPARGVANALAGVRGGATQVQGTINGYGERTGNCNLTTIIPNLTLKMGIETIPADRLERLTPVAHHVAELVNMALEPAGGRTSGRRRSRTRRACTSSAIAKRPDAYEHVAARRRSATAPASWCPSWRASRRSC